MGKKKRIFIGALIYAMSCTTVSNIWKKKQETTNTEVARFRKEIQTKKAQGQAIFHWYAEELDFLPVDYWHPLTASTVRERVDTVSLERDLAGDDDREFCSACNRDQEAIAKLYNRTYNSVYRTVVVQDSYVKGFQSLPNYRKRTNSTPGSGVSLIIGQWIICTRPSR